MNEANLTGGRDNGRVKGRAFTVITIYPYGESATQTPTNVTDNPQGKPAPDSFTHPRHSTVISLSSLHHLKKA